VGRDTYLSIAGHPAQEQWLRSSDIREEIELDAFVVMPNHLHGIVVAKIPGAADAPPVDVGAHGRAPLRPPLRSPRSLAAGHAPLPPPLRSPRSLGSFIAGFKPSATKCINAARGTPGAPVWQRNYHEHIIRNEDSLNRIRQYILDNPARWSMDRENPTSINPEPEGAWRV
jgi:REP element-mobilizing transposase RayT